MKKLFNNTCALIHVFFICFYNMAVIGFVTGYIADLINYHGVLNIFLFLAVGAAWLYTWYCFVSKVFDAK